MFFLCVWQPPQFVAGFVVFVMIEQGFLALVVNWQHLGKSNKNIQKHSKYLNRMVSFVNVFPSKKKIRSFWDVLLMTSLGCLENTHPVRPTKRRQKRVPESYRLGSRGPFKAVVKRRGVATRVDRRSGFKTVDGTSALTGIYWVFKLMQDFVDVGLSLQAKG